MRPFVPTHLYDSTTQGPAVLVMQVTKDEAFELTGDRIALLPHCTTIWMLDEHGDCWNIIADSNRLSPIEVTQ